VVSLGHVFGEGNAVNNCLVKKGVLSDVMARNHRENNNACPKWRKNGFYCDSIIAFYVFVLKEVAFHGI